MLFQTLDPFLEAGTITMTMTKREGIITVAIRNQPHPGNNQPIRPLIIKGPAEELDEEFIQKLTEPLERVKGITSNAALYVADAQPKALPPTKPAAAATAKALPASSKNNAKTNTGKPAGTSTPPAAPIIPTVAPQTEETIEDLFNEE